MCMDVECHGDYFGCVRQLFEGEFVRWFFFKGDKLSDFCQGLNMESAGSNNNDGDDLNISSKGAVCL